jgi:RecB family exonuclease
MAFGREIAALMFMAVVATSPLAPGAGAGEPVTPPKAPHDAAAPEGGMGRKFMTGIVALMDYCKHIEPARAAAIDADWVKAQVDLEPDMKAHIATPEFTASVAARLKELSASAEDPAEAASLKDTCSQMATGK